MQFKKNTGVYTPDNQQVGRIDRVVIDPRTTEVTHIVVRKGMLLTEDKVVPFDLVMGATEDRVTLQNIRLEALPDFEEKQYIPLDGADLPAPYTPENASLMYWYPYGSADYRQYARTARHPYIASTERNIPDHTIPLKEGATVISAEGETVGNVERVFVDPETDQVTTLLVSNGLILKEKMLLPVAWIARIGENEVYVAVNASILKRQSELLETWQELQEMVEEPS
jgi:uncharacterized protein YrrD